MACPHVAGLAALLLSQDASLTVDQLFHTLMDTAEDLGASGRDDQYGAGLISPVAALDGGATIYSLNTNKKNTLDPDVSPYQEWTVKATSGNIQISLTSDAGGRNLDLFLFDSAGAQVASSENTSGSEEISYYAAYPGETYTVRVELIRE
jgi:subtilisin family serine protease